MNDYLYVGRNGNTYRLLLERGIDKTKMVVPHDIALYTFGGGLPSIGIFGMENWMRLFMRHLFWQQKFLGI